MSQQVVHSKTVGKKRTLKPHPAKSLKPEWDVGGGYYYKHSVVPRGNTGEDVWLLQSQTKGLLDAIDARYKPRPDDIILCTFPKSGTTWVQAMLSMLLSIEDKKLKMDAKTVPQKKQDQEGEKLTSESLSDSQAKPEGKDWKAPSEGGVFVGLSAKDRIPWLESLIPIMGFHNAFNHINAMQCRRAFKTHCPIPLLKKRFMPGVKVIFVTRNPKDVCVSMWHHTRSKNFAYTGSFEHFTRHMFLRGHVESGSWFKFVIESYAAAGFCGSKDGQTCTIDQEKAEKNIANRYDFSSFLRPEDVLLLTYEQMHHDAANTVAKIAAHIGVSVTQSDCIAISKATNFENMARQERQDGCRLPGWPFRRLPGRSDSGDAVEFSALHCRKGGVGGWRDYFTDPQLLREFDATFENEMKGWDIKFNYGPEP